MEREDGLVLFVADTARWLRAWPKFHHNQRPDFHAWPGYRGLSSARDAGRWWYVPIIPGVAL